ncbi:chromosomal replication initiator protein DnaA [Anaeromyxobacter dehalogenans 2CP-1]|uniref:Chromosomal replication initiator protein DnaA n=1 Tax=Anaeromyxobacter dehalogenans (strain ATCC BAA-258 / DSM 21875 / 2CP-1) TaxID=455488 RepID=B8J6Y1_ANAD2|nr:chromosomal replication initiator protein DnaA [Anaeromyxobacter dehalogenans 2CP-1]
MEAPASALVETPLDDLWSRIDGFLRARCREDLYERWFEPLRPVSLDEGRLQIGAPDKFHRDFVEDNYRGWFEEFIPELTGERLRIAFAVDDAPRPIGAAAAPAPAAVAAARAPEPHLDPRDSRPNPRYAFDTFVVGASNHFAFAAAQAVAANPGRTWNPLFLHGDSGLGKTHLLHAVAHAILEKSGGRVAIVSSERYTNDFVAALSKGTMDEFRRKYRECSALLVDDVQFLAGKDKTAEEFFHTFNELHDHHVQIVLSSDRSPKELKGLDERLCSRFEWGMRVQIEVPEFETRAAILQKKADVEKIDLPDDVTQLLAQHIRSNVRELEGALMRLAAFASLKSEPITVPLARDVLADVIPPPGYRPPIEKIQEAVAGHYGLTVAKLTSASREQKIAFPRQVAMYLCRELAKEKFQSIAEKFNKKDHTTVIAAVDRVKGLLESDDAVRTAVAQLSAKLAP